MEILKIVSTDNTPGVLLDCKNHFIEFFGDSRPENTKLFYTPFLNWLNDYRNYLNVIQVKKNDTLITINVNFKLNYFNSSSVKYILEIIKLLKRISEVTSNIKLNVNWFYDDEDLLDVGKQLILLGGVKMNLIG